MTHYAPPSSEELIMAAERLGMTLSADAAAMFARYGTALAFENIDNTCPFNLTHHPALTLPCGMTEGCPVGLMLVAKPFAEATLYAAAYAFEQSVDWRRVVAASQEMGGI